MNSEQTKNSNVQKSTKNRKQQEKFKNKKVDTTIFHKVTWGQKSPPASIKKYGPRPKTPLLRLLRIRKHFCCFFK